MKTVMKMNMHYTTLNKGRSDLSPFLIGEGLRELIVETGQSCFYDKFPVSKGHSLIKIQKISSKLF
jgi:hypothetical protein